MNYPRCAPLFADLNLLTRARVKPPLSRMSTILASAFSPAESPRLDKRPVTAWEQYFVRPATKRDAAARPLEGIIGLSCGVATDLAPLWAAAKHKMREFVRRIGDAQEAPRPVGAFEEPHARSPLLANYLAKAFLTLEPGSLILLKDGERGYAWAEITSNYIWRGAEVWNKHAWCYRVLTFCEPAEVNLAAHRRMAFYASCIPVPARVLALRGAGAAAAERPVCPGCAEGAANQMGHMDPGGCLYTEEEDAS